MNDINLLKGNIKAEVCYKFFSTVFTWDKAEVENTIQITSKKEQRDYSGWLSEKAVHKGLLGLNVKNEWVLMVCTSLSSKS